MNLNNISINAKIIFMAVLLISAVILVSYISTSSLTKIGNELGTVAKQDMPLTKAITEVTSLQLEQAVQYERAYRYGEEMHENPVEATEFKKALDRFNEITPQVEETMQHAEELTQQAASGSEQSEAFTEILNALKNMELAHSSYEENAHKAFTHLVNHEVDQAHALSEMLEAAEDQLDHELETILAKVEGLTDEAMVRAYEHEQSALSTLTVIAITTTLGGALLAFIISIAVKKSLRDGLNEAIVVARTISSGDLTKVASTERKDELGELLSELEKMRAMLHKMITQVSTNSNELASAAEELSAVSEQTNQSLHQQHSEIDQIATAMNEMSSTVAEVASSASSTAQSANDANNETVDGGKAVDQVFQSSSKLSSGIDEASNVIKQLEQHSENIGGVMNVIKGVAEQTNLLALNAAIEAARAGDQGRGFAVVADEVRTLASRTQSSATEIEEMIEALQSGARSAVEVMNTSQSLASSNVDCAKQAGESLGVITNSVNTINTMNLQIASASEQQAAVADDINRGITSIKVAGEQITGAMSETTASSEELARMAASMQALVAKFSV